MIEKYKIGYYMNQATGSFISGKFDLGIKWCDDSLKAYPNNFEIIIRMGHLLSSRASSLKDFNRDKFDDFFSFHEHFGKKVNLNFVLDELLHHKNYKPAICHFELGTSFSLGFLFFANINALLEDYDQAREILEDCLPMCENLCDSCYRTIQLSTKLGLVISYINTLHKWLNKIKELLGECCEETKKEKEGNKQNLKDIYIESVELFGEIHEENKNILKGILEN